MTCGLKQELHQAFLLDGNEPRVEGDVAHAVRGAGAAVDDECTQDVPGGVPLTAVGASENTGGRALAIPASGGTVFGRDLVDEIQQYLVVAAGDGDGGCHGLVPFVVGWGLNFVS